MDDTLPNADDYPANGTIFDRLNAIGVSWRDYYSTLPTVFLYPQLYENNKKEGGAGCPTSSKMLRRDPPGILAWLTPNFGTGSEEDPQNITPGGG